MQNEQTILGVLGFVILVAGAIVGHFRSIGILKDKIHDMRVDIEKLKGKDELQQTIIDQIGRENDRIINHLLDILRNKEK